MAKVCYCVPGNYEIGEQSHSKTALISAVSDKKTGAHRWGTKFTLENFSKPTIIHFPFRKKIIITIIVAASVK